MAAPAILYRLALAALPFLIVPLPGTATPVIAPTVDEGGGSAGQPFACDKFSLRMVPQDAGTTIVWVVEHRCIFSSEFKSISVTTAENGAIRDHFDIPGSAARTGSTTRKVTLAQKALCAGSTVRVEASYRYLDTGDRQTAERFVSYDPNDNCGR